MEGYLHPTANPDCDGAGTPQSNSRTEGERLTLAWETPLTTIAEAVLVLEVLPEAWRPGAR